MNVQAHVPGQVPNQLPLQNTSASQMQHVTAAGGGGGMMGVGGGVSGGAGNMTAVDPEIIRSRLHMRERIFSVIMQRQANPDEIQKQKCKDFAKRIEEGLFRYSPNKEEYMNMNTLEARMSNLIKRSTVNQHNQCLVQLANSSSPVGIMIPTPGTMIPTPGMSHGGSSNLISSSDSMDAEILLQERLSNLVLTVWK